MTTKNRTVSRSTAELLELMAEIRVMVADINRMIEALEPSLPGDSAAVDAEEGTSRTARTGT